MVHWANTVTCSLPATDWEKSTLFRSFCSSVRPERSETQYQPAKV